MTEMKESKIEWVGKIPNTWNLIRLKDYFDFEKGKNAQQYTQEYIGENQGLYPVYSGQTENEGIMGRIRTYDYDIDKCIFTTTVGAKVMTVKLLEGKFSLSQNCLIMKKIKKCNEKFIYYLLQPLFENEKNKIPSYMQPSLRMEDLKSYSFHIPRIEEQVLIANLLDNKIEKIDNIINDLSKEIKTLEKYKKSLITEIVTKGITANAEFKKIKIGRVVELRQGLAINAQTNNLISTKETSLPLLRIADMNSGTKEIFMEEKIPRQYIANKKDLIYTRTGQVGLIFRNQEGVVHNNCFRVIPKNEDILTREYLYWTLKSDKFYQYANMLAFGSAQPDLSHSSFKLIEINVFLKEEQLKIANFLNIKCAQIDEIIKDKQNQIDKMEKYKKSLIYEYVTGKKRVKGAEELYV